MSFGHKAQESIDKVGTLNARVQRQHELVTAFDCTLECRKGSANGVADLTGPLARACYGVHLLQKLDELQPRGVDKSPPCWI